METVRADVFPAIDLDALPVEKEETRAIEKKLILTMQFPVTLISLLSTLFVQKEDAQEERQEEKIKGRKQHDKQQSDQRRPEQSSGEGKNIKGIQKVKRAALTTDQTGCSPTRFLMR